MVENTISLLQPHGGNIYRHPGILDFSANINPLGMPESVLKAAIEGVKRSEAYPDPNLTDLTEAYSSFHHISADKIVFGNGASELIRALPAAIRAEKTQAGSKSNERICTLPEEIRKRSSRAAVVLPCFSEYIAGCKCAGMQIQAVSFERLQDVQIQAVSFKKIQTEMIMENSESEPDLLIIGNPSNPDGRIFTRETIVRLAERYRYTAICVDESFLPFCKDAQERSLIPCLEQHRNLFVIRSFTKIYAMPGLRLGALLSADESVLSVVRRLLQPWNVSVPAQAAGIAALQESGFVEDSVRFLQKERPYLEQGLADVPFVNRIMPSSANYILFHVTERTPHELFQRLLMQNIQIRDCSSFEGMDLLVRGTDTGEEDWKTGWYRIAVRTHEENKRLLEALGQIWRRGIL